MGRPAFLGPSLLTAVARPLNVVAEAALASLVVLGHASRLATKSPAMTATVAMLFAFAALPPLVYGALTVSAYLGVGPLFFDAVVGAAFLVAGVIFGRAALDDARLHPGVGYLWIGAGAWPLFTAAAVAVAVFFGLQLPPIWYI